MKKQIAVDVTIDVEGDKCGDGCPKLKITHDLFDRYVTFYWCHIQKPKIKLCKCLNDLPFQPTRCQLCITAERKADDSTDWQAEWAEANHKLFEMDALIDELVDALEQTMRVTRTVTRYLDLNDAIAMRNTIDQALAHAKEMRG